MPFKAKAACRHHIPKQRHRVTNWAEYDAGLRARGSLTVWFTPEAVAGWTAEPRTRDCREIGGQAAAAAAGSAFSRRRHLGPKSPPSLTPNFATVPLRCIAERGRMGWQKASGYNWRALVEADIARWKRVVGDGLRFQTDGRQASEVAIAADVLNRMLELGRPEYVRTA